MPSDLEGNAQSGCPSLLSQRPHPTFVSLHCWTKCALVAQWLAWWTLYRAYEMRSVTKFHAVSKYFATFSASAYSSKTRPILEVLSQYRDLCWDTSPNIDVVLNREVVDQFFLQRILCNFWKPKFANDLIWKPLYIIHWGKRNTYSQRTIGI